MNDEDTFSNVKGNLRKTNDGMLRRFFIFEFDDVVSSLCRNRRVYQFEL